ncbi:MAG: tetratricopeptide repeat protein [Candidatus Hydrogenedentes bacterium]|nr:tetratricopeptide repeat protein [Candidatus Hydrogenedentota bacterium]
MTAACAVVAVAGFAAFSPALRAGFTNWDDTLYVTENSRIQQGLTIQNAAWALTARHVSNWHPLAWMSHMTDVSLFGLNPAGHHLTSIVIHCAAAVMLLLFLHRATGDLPKSLLVAGLFALHPLRVESVAWVAERKDVLSAFFGFAWLWAYAVYAEKPSAGRYAGMAGLLALSLMSKPMLVTAPFLLLLVDYWPLRRFDSPGVTRKLLLEKLPLLALVCGVSVLAFIAQRSGASVGTFEVYPLPARLWNAAIAYWMYVWKTIWPANLALFYPHRGAATSATAGVIAATGLGTATVAAVALRRRAPFVTVGWLWYLGLLVPVIGLVQIGQQAYADRYTYLPSVGLYMAAVWGVAAVIPRNAVAKKAAVAISAAILAALAVATAAQAVHWRNSETIWRKTVASTDKNTLALVTLANVFQQQGRAEEAWQTLERALEIDPGNSTTYGNFGRFKLDEGKPQEAVPFLDEALRLRPSNKLARINLGIALCSLGRVEEGTRHLREVLQIDPANLEANYNLGVAVLAQKRYDEAAGCFVAVIEATPGDVPARVGYAASLVHLGKPAEAIPQFQEALRLDPQNADALAYLRQLNPNK